MGLAEGRKIIGISSQKRPLVSVRVTTWLCRSHSWPSMVWAQIWTRRCAKGIPSPARRTVPNIQKPPPPMRSTIGVPVRQWMTPPRMVYDGASPVACVGRARPVNPETRMAPGKTSNERRVNWDEGMPIILSDD